MTLKEISKEIKKLKNVLIFCHTRPDGDAIGSSKGLKLILNSIDIKARIICDSIIPEKFSFLVNSGDFLTELPKDNDIDGIITVDSSDENRLGEFNNVLNGYKVKSINIDHHISNTRFAKFNFVEERSSTCEIILELGLILNPNLSKEAADCLLLGICTDTGSFAHQNVTKDTLLSASKLVAFGADLHTINYNMFKKQKKARVNLFAKVISKLRYYYEDKIALIFVNREMIESADASDDMTEGFIDYPLSVEGVEVAVCMLESKQNQYKISFRSKGKADVNEIASHFGGGGHILASGCKINGEFEEVIDKLVYTISQRL